MHARNAPSSDTLAFAALAVLLVLALLFGGGPRGAGDALVHVAMLPCLLLGILRWRTALAGKWDRAFLGWWLLALAVIALQLLPLPPVVFERLPQRAAIAADLARAGIVPGWRPMTLDVWATVRGGLALLTFGATWMLAMSLDESARRRLLFVALGVAVALALFGFAQAAAGTHALRFYEFHHPTGALGTFANRNHFASLLGMLLPFALAFAAQAQDERRMAQAIAWFGATIALWLAAALSYSRAGFLLASFALIVSACVLWWPRRGEGRRWIGPLLALCAAGLGVAHYAWNGLLQRLDADPLGDLRWQYLRYGSEAMKAYFPWGSGVGSFPWVYAPMEPLDAMGATFAERAHNEPLQIAIEAGIPGVIVALLFLTLVGVKVVRNFPIGLAARVGQDRVRSVIAVALAVPLLHSVVDYPLRTMAIAVAAGLLLSIGGWGQRAAV